jgi:hypothetical protein
MKTGNFFSIFCFVLFISLVYGCVEYPASEVTERPYVNKTSLNMYIGDEEQLKSSPVGVSYTWSSDNEAVASVTQTGKITAVSEGSAVITVASDNDKTTVEVRVRTFIPVTDINLSQQSLTLYKDDKIRLLATPVPNNASEATVRWRSANANIATVDSKGNVTAIAGGVVDIIVSAGGFEKTVPVRVIELYKLDKTGWTVEVSDAHTEGGGKDKIIDNDYGTGGYWHSMYSPNAPLPHWAIIDMKEPQEVARIVTLRRNNGDTKTLQYFVGDSPDPDGEWTKVAEGMYASTSANHTMTLDVADLVTGRYLKLILPDSYRQVFTAIHEIDVYGMVH